MAGASGRQYVAPLLVNSTTGEIEAYGPADEPDAIVLAAELQTALAADAELREGWCPGPAATTDHGPPC
jgi:hypothetical protein